MRNISLVILSLFGVLTGCETLNFSGKKVILPESPLISVEQLKSSGNSCRKSVENLSDKRSHVPLARRDEFNQILGMAEDNCDALVDTLERMRAATYYDQALKQNIQHAQSIILPGVRVVEDSGMPFFNSFNNDKKIEQPVDDLVPLDDSPISSEPLE